MGKEKKKYESGAATTFVGRNQAIKKLQLTIADFRRLCILKGVFPIEPKHKKKVNKGSTANKTFYYAKDINFLANEPIINKFREFKTYVKRLKRARGRRDVKALARLRNNKPTYKVDHIVKERYPSYTDAVRDLDDFEFMHYVIASKSLRKCFISIKGFYFQADIKGQKITWVMPHQLAYQTPDDVDFRIMSTFVEFYSIMLGFVNFKSYQDVGLIYPPKLSISPSQTSDKLDQDDFNDEFLSSLNCDVLKLSEGAESAAQGDEFPLVDEENPELIEKAKIDEDNLRKLKVLFKGLKFFLNREVPREQFVFAIRAFSGQVSWDSKLAHGATYPEDDESITHQIIDRPLAGKTYMNRIYVQPQWVFDCINENMLLPVDEYLPGALLPPHLSPFVEDSDRGYLPPEKKRLIKMKLGIVDEEKHDQPAPKKVDEVKNDSPVEKKVKEVEVKKVVEKKEEKVEEEEEDGEEEGHGMRVDLDSPDEESESEDEEEIEESDEEEKKKDKTETKIAVVKGKPKQENVNMLLKKQMDEEKKLNEMMIPKKHKRLYNKIMYKQKKEKQETEKLTQKRQKYEESQSKMKNKTR